MLILASLHFDPSPTSGVEAIFLKKSVFLYDGLKNVGLAVRFVKESRLCAKTRPIPIEASLGCIYVERCSTYSIV